MEDHSTVGSAITYEHLRELLWDDQRNNVIPKLVVFLVRKNGSRIGALQAIVIMIELISGKAT